jgi:hypothetical protein
MSSVLDLLSVFIVIIASMVVLFVCWVLMDAFAGSGMFTAEGITAMNAIKSLFESFDLLMVFVIFGLCIVSGLLAFLIPSHPAFLVINIILLAILIPVSSMLANVYYELSTSPEFSSAASHFPYTYQVFSYLPLITLVMDVIIIVLSNAKPASGVQY